MPPITTEEHNGHPLVVSSTPFSDDMSVMFYRIKKDSPEYEIEIYSHTRHAATEDILWLDYDSEYGCGDVRTFATIQIDDQTEDALQSDGYYNDGSIIFHAQLTQQQAQRIKIADTLQLNLSIPGLIINKGNNSLVITKAMLNEWQQIIA